jgi:hypothetical protein
MYLIRENLKNEENENPEIPAPFNEYSKYISLKNLPKYYRNKEPLTFLIEKVKEK